MNFSLKEVWFDDVDPEDLEEITGKKTKTETGDTNDFLVTGSLEGLVSYTNRLLFTFMDKERMALYTCGRLIDMP